LAALTDIQSELQAAEAQALRELLHVLSHEIMNSLTPVASLAESASELLAHCTPESSNAARDAVETLGRRAAGLTRFVQGYRSLARLPAPNLRPVQLARLLDDVARLFRARWDNKVTLDITEPDSDLEAKVDPDLISQALLNLLVNGAEAALEGGCDTPTVSLAARRTGEGVVLTVGDNGPGVPPTQRDQLFRPFFTTKATGTGVGLAIARQVALAHGGDLALEPEFSVPGAAFVLRL
jgi:signal transduction histidine kinase